jgi:hypothetical protein
VNAARAAVADGRKTAARWQFWNASRTSKLYLNHLIDSPGEYVVVDCTAGADYSEGFDVPVALVGNKAQTPDDLAFLRAHAADEPLAGTRAATAAPVAWSVMAGKLSVIPVRRERGEGSPRSRSRPLAQDE